MPPHTLGPYRIEKPLGKGGMGTVYLATHAATGDACAVKVLSPELAQAEGFRDRFEAEIESLRTLRHPGIVRLIGYGEESGSMYYSMELVEGASLEEELRAGRRFYWREVIRIAVQVCHALKHAHDHGVIHRDIKPANILLTTDERVKLADFGIAQLFGGAKLTTARGVLGTADFMSPEQAEGRPITDRCDQYSLGCVMYTLLAGRTPFRAKTLPEMLQLQRFAEAEPVRRFAPDAPAQLERVIAQLLEKSPRDRFPNVKALARHLEAMGLALSRTGEDDFDLTHDDPRGDKPPAGGESLSATLADVSHQSRLGREGASQELGSMSDSGRAAATLAPSDATRRGATQGPKLQTPEQAASYTEVVERWERDGPTTPGWLQAAYALAAIGLFAGVVTALVWSLRPDSADELFERFTRADRQGGSELLVAADALEEFRDRFPDDPRQATAEKIARRLELLRLERRLTGPRGAGDGAASPVTAGAEELYAAILADAQQEPDAAAGRLRALSRLLEDAARAEPNPADAQALRALRTLAARKASALDSAALELHDQRRPFLERRMASAAELAKSDPAAAAALYDAVVALYANQPWAAEAVERARREAEALRP